MASLPRRRCVHCRGCRAARLPHLAWYQTRNAAAGEIRRASAGAVNGIRRIEDIVMPDGIPMEALLTAGYAGFLVVVALVLERLAKHARRRTERLELTGFRYHHDMDPWE